MKVKKFFPLFLMILFGCSSAIPIPERQKVIPNEDELFLGTEYRNQKGTLNKQGIPPTPMTYFNYEDFKDFDPVGQIIAENPYDSVEDLSKIPADKIGLYHKISIDSSQVNHLSKILFDADEPVLSNFFTGKETYRFIWTRAFHDDYIFKIFKEVNQAKVETIRVDKQSGELERKVKRISVNEFEGFISMIYKSAFWAMEPYDWVLGVDGSTWTIEAHVPVGYKVLSRSSPGLIYEDDLILRQLGEWFINKSGVDNQEIY